MSVKYKIAWLIIGYLAMVGTYAFLYTKVRASPIYLDRDSGQVEHWGKEIASCMTLKNCSYDIGRRNIVLLGDSHAMQLVFGFKQHFPNDNVILLSAEIFSRDWFDSAEFPDADTIKGFLKGQLKSGDLVVVALAQHHAFVKGVRKVDKRDKILRILESIVEAAGSSGAKLVVFRDTPRLRVDLPISVCKRQLEVRSASDCDVGRDDALKERAALDRVIDDLATRSKVLVLDPFHAACPEIVCRPFVGGKQYFIDQNHVSKLVSGLIVSQFKGELNGAG